MRMTRMAKSDRAIARRRPGFVLSELVVAIALFAVLAGIAYPSYQAAVRKAKRAEGRLALMQLMQQQERFYSRHHRYAEFSSASPATGGPGDARFKWYSGDSPKASAYELSARACDGGTLEECILLIAEPGTDKIKQGFEDAECGALTLTSKGVKGARGTHSSCW